MARGFGTTDGSGTTDVLTTAQTGNNAVLSWSIWTWRTGSGGGGFGRMFDKDHAGTGARVFFHDNATSEYVLQIDFSGSRGQWAISSPSGGANHHILITYDGSSTANDPIIYVDGSPVTVTRQVAPVGTIQTSANAYRIGNRADGVRVWNGRLAEFAIWHGSILTAGNAASLASGDLADTIGSPVDFWKICGTASPEPNEIGGGSGSATVTGTTLQTHPTSNCTAGTYTLAAEAGAYTLSGSALSFLITRVLVCTAGSVVLTGADVTFTTDIPVFESVVGPVYRLEYRTDHQVPFWTGDGGAMWTGDDLPFWVARGDWSPWPGELTGLIHQPYEFRLTVRKGLSQRKVTALMAHIDMPDVEEQLLNVAIGSSGTRLTLTKSYQAIKVVFPTLLADGGTARSILIADKDLGGPLVEAYDESGLTTAHADFLVQGY